MQTPETETNTAKVQFVAQLGAAYLSHNHTSIAEIPALIAMFGAQYDTLTMAAAPAAPVVEAKAPAVSIRKSVTPDFLISLEDGRKYKSLKRHLRTAYNMSPEQYRAKWGLPADYPMTAPNYAARRSELAKSIGLGRIGGPGRSKATEAVKAAPKAKAKAAPKAKAPKTTPAPKAPETPAAAPATAE